MEHTLHGITLFSVVIAALGFLFLSYEFLDRPHGILRWLIQVIVPGLVFALPWSILAFFLPASWMLGPFSLKDIATNFAFYGGLIGFFNGLFAGTSEHAVPRQSPNAPVAVVPQQLPLPPGMNSAPLDLACLVSQQKDDIQQPRLGLDDSPYLMQKLPTLWEKLLWLWNTFLRDAATGFVFASTFWFVETFLILGLPLYDFTLNFLGQEYAGFAVVGLVGGSLWRFIHQPMRQTADGLRLLSLRYFLAGFVVWMGICLLVGLLAVPVFTFLWHTQFAVPFAILVGFLFIGLLGALASSFTGFALHRRARLDCAIPAGSSAPLSGLGGGNGPSDHAARRLEKRKAPAKPSLLRRLNEVKIVPWLFTWLITGLGILFFAQPVLAPLTEMKIDFENLDITAYLTLLSQRFLVAVLLGTALTLLAGSCAALLVHVIYHRIRQALSASMKNPWFILPNNPVVRAPAGLGRRPQSYSGSIFSSLLDGLIGLAMWYEIWFVFAVVLLLDFLFKPWGLPVIVIAGVAVTLLGGGLFRYLLVGGRRRQRVEQRARLALVIRRASLMKPVFWPLLWLVIWVMVTTTLLSQDDQAIVSLLNAAFSQVSAQAQQTDELLRQSFFREEQHIILIGSAITAVAGGLVVLLWRAVFLCVQGLRASFVGKYAFRNALSSGGRARVHAFVLRSLEHDPDRPFIFSLRESLLRLAFWTGTWFISGTITFIGFAIINNVAQGQGLGSGFGFDFSFFLYGFLGVIAIALASALTGGFSNAILLWATRLPGGKRLGALGVVLTIAGFLLQLIEPTVLLAYQPPTYGHTGAVLAVAWSEDGRQIASASADATVQVWAIGQVGDVLTYRGHDSGVETLAWSPDGKYIVSGSTDGLLQLWDATSGRTVSTGAVGKGSFTVAWSPLGDRIAATSPDGVVLLWTTAKKDGTKTVVNLAGNESALGSPADTARVTKLAWSPDGAFIAATRTDGTVSIWKLTENVYDSSEVTFSPHAGSLRAITWKPDGKEIAIAGSDMSVQVWDVTRKQKVFTYYYSAVVNALAWSPDGKFIAIADADGTASVLDPAPRVGRLVATYRGHFGGVNALAWSHDSSLIASASDDKTVQVWDAATGNHIFTYGASGSTP